MINRLLLKLFNTNDIRLVHLAKTCFIFICQVCFYSKEQKK